MKTNKVSECFQTWRFFSKWFLCLTIALNLSQGTALMSQERITPTNATLPSEDYWIYRQDNMGCSKVAPNIFFNPTDVASLRAKAAAGRMAPCAKMVEDIASLYLENVQPARWAFENIDENNAVLIEKYLLRLSFAYVLTNNVLYSDLARHIALKVCQYPWAAGDATKMLQRGLACTIDWTQKVLPVEHAEYILSFLPKGDLAKHIGDPVAEMEIDLKKQEWIVWEGDKFGADFKLGSVLGPPSAWYAFTAAKNKDPEYQWLSEQVYQRMPAQSAHADEVWSIIFYDPSVPATRPAQYSDELQDRAIEQTKQRLAEMIVENRKGADLSFDLHSKQPVLPELMGVHPRLIIQPHRKLEMIYRGAAMPERYWKLSDLEPAKPPIFPRHGRVIRPKLTNPAVSYLAIGQDLYAENAILTMLRLSTAFPHWGGYIGGRWEEHSLSGSEILLGVGIAYDAFYHCMTPDQRKVIRDRLVEQARIMHEEHLEKKELDMKVPAMAVDLWIRHNAHSPERQMGWEHNHIYNYLGGLWTACSAIIDEAPQVQPYYDFGVRAIKRMTYLLNSPDATFSEGLIYWYYGTSEHVVPFLDLFRNITGVDTFGYFAPSLANQKHYLMHSLLPGDKDWLCYGDMGELSSSAWLMEIFITMSRAASEYRDGQAQGLAEYCIRNGDISDFESVGYTRSWGIRNGIRNDYRCFLAWDPGVKPVDPYQGELPYRHFTDLDIVCIRTGWQDDATHFAFRSGPSLGHRMTDILVNNELPEWWPHPTHVHPDLNAFLIFDHGEHLAVDTGYIIPKLTRVHNTISVDGGGQLGEGQNWPIFAPYDQFAFIGKFFPAADAYYYVCGQAGNAYKANLELEKFDRHIIMMPDSENTYFLIHDELASAKQHNYDWRLHSASQAEIFSEQSVIEGGQANYTIRQNKRALTVNLLTPKSPAIKSGKNMVQTLYDPAIDTKGIPMEQRGFVLSVSPTAKSKEQAFLTVLTCHDSENPGPSVQNTDAGKAVIITTDRWTDVLAITGSGGGLISDGAYAMTRRQDSELVRWAVLDATKLSFQGEKLFAASSLCSVAGKTRESVLEITIDAQEAVEVVIYLSSKPDNIKLDGKAIPVKYDASPKRLELNIPSGSHSIVASGISQSNSDK